MYRAREETTIARWMQRSGSAVREAAISRQEDRDMLLHRIRAVQSGRDLYGAIDLSDCGSSIAAVQREKEEIRVAALAKREAVKAAQDAKREIRYADDRRRAADREVANAERIVQARAHWTQRVADRAARGGPEAEIERARGDL